MSVFFWILLGCALMGGVFWLRTVIIDFVIKATMVVAVLAGLYVVWRVVF